MQLPDSDFFRHLLAFSAVRKQHDAIFAEQFTPEQQAWLTHLHLPNRFYTAGVRDGDMRQHFFPEDERPRPVAEVGYESPKSKSLLLVGGLLSEEVLAAVDEVVERVGMEASRENVERALGEHARTREAIRAVNEQVGRDWVMDGWITHVLAYSVRYK